MKLTHDELEFLSAWAREEWEPACYELPAHRLQLAHGVAGAQLILFIKAWTEGEGKKDQEILAVAVNPQPRWPWSTTLPCWCACLACRYWRGASSWGCFSCC